jgi:hypothetical protein
MKCFGDVINMSSRKSTKFEKSKISGTPCTSVLTYSISFENVQNVFICFRLFVNVGSGGRSLIWSLLLVKSDFNYRLLFILRSKV